MSNIHIWAHTNTTVEQPGNQVPFINLSSQDGKVTFTARPDAPAALGTSKAVQVWLDGEEKAVLQSLKEAISKRLSDLQVDCPHAAPFRYCDGCKVSPCPIGMDKK